MCLKVKVKVETAYESKRKFSRIRRSRTYTPVTPLSTTVPGRVLPFLSACRLLVGKNLCYDEPG